MQTSIVIPLATGSFASHWNDTELRYCLRSVERYLKCYGDIFIIGKAPVWLQNVTVIPATDNDKIYYKERNIFNKIMLACQDERVSEDFLFMNDDHFLLSEFEAGNFPYYWDGTIGEHVERSDPYGNTARNTMEWLSMGDIVPYFDIHAPILYCKNKLPFWVRGAPWEKKYGFCIKTVYALFAGSNPTQYPDLKLSGSLSSHEIKEKIKGRLFFSTNDNCRDGGMEAVLQELYPNKSNFER